MEKELRGYVIEIIVMLVILFIAVPTCVSASNNYKEKQDKLLNGFKTTIDITSKIGNVKQVTLYSNAKKVVKVKLGLMITQFYDEYLVEIDGQTYDLNELECLYDDNYRYYILGVYEIDEIRNIDFELKVKDKSYYDESLTYSFYTEGII